MIITFWTLMKVIALMKVRYWRYRQFKFKISHVDDSFISFYRNCKFSEDKQFELSFVNFTNTSNLRHPVYDLTFLICPATITTSATIRPNSTNL